MKIEVSFPELDAVLNKMGIKRLVRDEHTPIWETIDVILKQRGKESDTLKDVGVDPDGTLVWEGRKILVYIRDQNIIDSGEQYCRFDNAKKISPVPHCELPNLTGHAKQG